MKLPCEGIHYQITCGAFIFTTGNLLVYLAVELFGNDIFSHSCLLEGGAGGDLIPSDESSPVEYGDFFVLHYPSA